MMDGNAADLLHPMREHGVSGHSEDRNSGQHKILTKVHGKFRWLILNHFTTKTPKTKEKQKQRKVSYVSLR
jgi:hypothetical protein